MEETGSRHCSGSAKAKRLSTGGTHVNQGDRRRLPACLCFSGRRCRPGSRASRERPQGQRPQVRPLFRRGLGMDVRPGLQARRGLAQDQTQFLGAYRQLRNRRDEGGDRSHSRGSNGRRGLSPHRAAAQRAIPGTARLPGIRRRPARLQVRASSSIASISCGSLRMACSRRRCATTRKSPRA